MIVFRLGRIAAVSAAVLLSSFIAKAEIRYVDASTLDIHGKICENTSETFTRLPASLLGVARDPVWELGRMSAGIYVRFRSNSTSVWARWTSTFKYSMNHMADTGTRGIDLYVLDGRDWRYVGVGRPEPGDSTSTKVIIDGMDGGMHEFMMYLSLYDGIKSLSIGVDDGSFIGSAEVDSPRTGKPVIVYGTSVTQGGCVSRPGMCYTSILERRFDREFVNLGFSGNGIIDYEIAELMASHPDPGCFVLDYVGNAYAEKINEKGEKFFRILRDAHPDVPVLFLSAKTYPKTAFRKATLDIVMANNAAQKALFDKLKKQGEKNIFLVPLYEMTGDASEQTVDNDHLTDLGTTLITDYFTPYFRKVLKKIK